MCVGGREIAVIVRRQQWRPYGTGTEDVNDIVIGCWIWSAGGELAGVSAWVSWTKVLVEVRMVNCVVLGEDRVDSECPDYQFDQTRKSPVRSRRQGRGVETIARSHVSR